MTAVRRRLTIACCVLVGFVAGCSSHPATKPAAKVTGSAVSPSANPTLNSGGTPGDLVLTDTLQAEQDHWYLTRVQGELVRRCMAAHGLQYFPTDVGPLPISGTVTTSQAPPDPSNGYGLYAKAQANALESALASTFATAANHGLGTPSLNQQARYVQGLPPAQQAQYGKVYFGASPKTGSFTLPNGSQITFTSGGCLGAAYHAIYGSAIVANELLSEPEIIAQELQSELKASRTYVIADERWRTCMTKSGFNYSDPSDAVSSLAGEYATQGPTPALHVKELAVAKADSRCDARSHLRATMATLQDKLLTKMSATIERDATNLDQYETEAVARAKRLLAGD